MEFRPLHLFQERKARETRGKKIRAAAGAEEGCYETLRLFLRIQLSPENGYETREEKTQKGEEEKKSDEKEMQERKGREGRRRREEGKAEENEQTEEEAYPFQL